MRILLAALAFLALNTSIIGQELAGDIVIDGSSSTYLISEAVATTFKKQHGKVNFTVGISGTGTGFTRFANREVDITGACRPMRPVELERCQQNGVEFVELKIAYDAIAVVINPDNRWAEHLSVEQLRRIWHPDTAARKWRDVDPAWPDQQITLLGPAPCLGDTFDFFALAINGKEGLCRKDVFGSQVDDTTLERVQGRKYAMGFVGVAYYEQHKDQVKAVAISTGEGVSRLRPLPPLETATRPPAGVLPSRQTVLDGSYRPLSRLLYIYVNKESLKRPEVAAFVRLHVERQDLVRSVQSIDLPAEQVEQELRKMAGAKK